MMRKSSSMARILAVPARKMAWLSASIILFMIGSDRGTSTQDRNDFKLEPFRRVEMPLFGHCDLLRCQRLF
jgi:hypothetical protein